jgi:cell wall-associated NlpC family hydrolase
MKKSFWSLIALLCIPLLLVLAFAAACSPSGTTSTCSPSSPDPNLPNSSIALSAYQVAQIASQVGFSGSNLAIAVAVAHAESGFKPNATLHNTNGSTDYGLFQINSIHAALLQSGNWSNPADNARMAFTIFSQSGWQPWVTYWKGTYLQFMPEASAAVDQLMLNPAAPQPSFQESTCSNTQPTQGESASIGALGAVNWAVSHLNIPYLWGGCLSGVPSCSVPTDPNMDCSGFTSAAWWYGAHIAIPRTAAMQYNFAHKITPGTEQPGDLVFMEFGQNGPGHVMIVIGNGKAAEEPQTGDVSKVISYSGISGMTFGRVY